jgi:GTP diphosphokinase / guanosine-3',5'-bis(diphosphate) 3'-diphosphatase
VLTDVFSEQVFAFTPKGDVIDLPKGSTPVDFAFRIHSSIGHTLVGSKVNGAIVPLAYELKNGDVVELITRNNAQPNLDWLSFVKSPHTKNKLRTYFRKRDKDERVAQGKSAVEKEVRALGLDPRVYLGDDMMREVVKRIKDCDTAEDVFARVGEGLTSVRSVVDKIKALLPEQPPESSTKARKDEAKPTVITTGVDNVMVKRARCCQPVPGEETIGYVTRGRGIVLHQRVCQNVLALMEREADRITPIRWEPDGKTYEVTIKVLSTNRQGLLADMSNVFSESKVNVVAGQINTTKHNTADNDFTIEVRDLQHLHDVTHRLGQFSDIISVLRVQPRGGRS